MAKEQNINKTLNFKAGGDVKVKRTGNTVLYYTDTNKENPPAMMEFESIEGEIDLTLAGETWKRLGAELTNSNKPYKMKHYTGYEYGGQAYQLIAYYKIVHVSNLGRVWWVEDEEEEIIFNTTVHEHPY